MPISFDRAPAPVTVTLECEGGEESERTRWSIRPLSPAELAAAVRTAGPVPVRGRRVLQSEREGVPIETPEDAEAADEARRWVMRHHEALACAALVAVDGETVTDAAALLQSIRPASLHPSVVLELGRHVQELSDLSPKERASYGSPSGSGGTVGAEGGSAASVKTEPC
jgi:hypothetical protein